MRSHCKSICTYVGGVKKLKTNTTDKFYFYEMNVIIRNVLFKLFYLIGNSILTHINIVKTCQYNEVL